MDLTGAGESYVPPQAAGSGVNVPPVIQQFGAATSGYVEISGESYTTTTGFANNFNVPNELYTVTNTSSVAETFSVSAEAQLSVDLTGTGSTFALAYWLIGGSADWGNIDIQSQPGGVSVYTINDFTDTYSSLANLTTYTFEGGTAYTLLPGASDDLQVGSGVLTNALPEPGTWLTLGLGAAG